MLKTTRVLRMNIPIHGSLRNPVRLLRWQLYPIYHKLCLRHLDAPIVFCNSLPKSGTHLLLQILWGLKSLGPFWDRGSFVRTHYRRTNVKRPVADVVRDIHGLLPGEIALGHVHATLENVSALVQPGIANYFIYRDPRDVAVSRTFFVTEIAPKHWLHRYYTQVLNNLEDRIAASILGISDVGLDLPNIRLHFEPYLGWLEQDQVICIRFEDLVHDKRQVLGQILDHLEASGYQLSSSREEAVDVLAQSIDPAQSPTFREGKTGSWRKYFTPEHKKLFKQVAGDLLIRLGYERGADW